MKACWPISRARSSTARRSTGPRPPSTADEADRPLLDQLRLLAALADLAPLSTPRASTGDTCASSSAIGRGAFGEVYRAWDTRLDREVALKLLRPAIDSRRTSRRPPTRSSKKAACSPACATPNVVTIYGAERIDDRIGLWMEFVKGRTLEQVVEQGKVFSAAEAVTIGIELCRAMTAVHAAGLLHRDIKAHNVMLAEDGRDRADGLRHGTRAR